MDTAQKEMPQCKVAMKIKKFIEPLPSGGCVFYPEDDEEEPLFLSAKYMQKHNPHVGGYYVAHEDGTGGFYETFSPAEAFEDGYTRTGE
jgi:hypothetical protein